MKNKKLLEITLILILIQYCYPNTISYDELLELSKELALQKNYAKRSILGKLIFGKQLKEMSSKNCHKEFRKAALDTHNKYRKLHKTESLAEDANLNEQAQKYADKLANTHSLTHSTGRVNTGENLFARITSSGMNENWCREMGKACVEAWYSEMKNYDFSNPGFTQKTGHFTQLLWSGSKRVGMGLGVSKHKGLNAFYCVAQYQPAGNVLGHFKENVRKI